MDQWRGRFRNHVNESLTPGISILDIGAGSQPTIPPEDRPSDTTYVGLDIAAKELAKAPIGSYDETVAAPIEEPIPNLRDRFDLCVSWMAFEHIGRVELALTNLWSYLQPGGSTVIQMAGRNSPSSILNRFLPDSVGRKIVQKTQGREPDSIFPAVYDKCSHRALSRILREGEWADWKVEPLFLGAGYFLFSRVLTACYVAYEEWAYRGDHANVAPYYLLSARRAGL
jgi:cyclopropane fatty-acyl-phospholipid synthase-like methyltransferase